MVVRLLIRGQERLFERVEIVGKTIDCENFVRVENGKLIFDEAIEMYGDFKVKKDRDDIVIEKL